MWKKKDPVDNFEKRLLNDGVLSELEVFEIKNEINQAVMNAHVFAEKSPYPNESELKEYVFKQ